ncbi:MAG: ATP-binding cassette domain-containing protein [Acetobacteraceae bacterium]|nr:ATP-binding cassette domain-containing protein [Acetobacteraceae bacterium]
MQPIGSAVDVCGVTKRFGDRLVLDGVDLHIEPGSFVSIVGRSGGGKSTLLRLIGGLDQPSLGTVRLDGAERSGLAPQMTMMFQDARLLPWQRVLGNVSVTRNKHWRRDAVAALAEVGLADRAGEWPSVLSGGQRQRVALARALVSRPHLLLLDEPLGALDALTRREMQRLIERLWQEQRFTAVLVTHDVAEAVALSDRVIVLRDGRIASDHAISIPRPHGRTAGKTAELEAEILEELLL